MHGFIADGCIYIRLYCVVVQHERNSDHTLVSTYVDNRSQVLMCMNCSCNLSGPTQRRRSKITSSYGYYCKAKQCLCDRCSRKQVYYLGWVACTYDNLWPSTRKPCIMRRKSFLELRWLLPTTTIKMLVRKSLARVVAEIEPKKHPDRPYSTFSEMHYVHCKQKSVSAPVIYKCWPCP